MKRFSIWCVAVSLMALVVGGGLVDSVSDLLMLSPFIVLLLPLMAGLYPGESAIESLAEMLDARRRPSRSMPRIAFPEARFADDAVRIAGSIGSRGPPSLCV